MTDPNERYDRAEERFDWLSNQNWGFRIKSFNSKLLKFFIDELEKIAEKLERKAKLGDDELESISSIADFNVEKVCQGLQDKIFKNIIVITGAGVSTSAGIPDFRTPGTGLYDNLQGRDNFLSCK